MVYTDAAVIGAGVLGCFAARALTQLDISVTVIEAREDVCTGITRANTGIIYTGYDNHPGSVKAGMCARANADFDRLCRELDVRFHRCGSVMAAFGPNGMAVLEKKLRQGRENGVPGLRIVRPEELFSLEPHLSRDAVGGLYAPGTGTVDPWELGIAAFENAAANGADFRLNERLLKMERTGGGILLETDRETYRARTAVNCAGLQADAVREMLCVPAVRIFSTGADYIVLDDTLSGFLRHVIFHEPEEKGKGLTLVPTVDGNILIGPTERSRTLAPDGAVSGEGLRELERLCAEIMPEVPLSERIRGFSALRPNPRVVWERDGVWVPTDRSINDFTIYNENGLISLLGIKTPGLTCAAELGRLCAVMAGENLGSPERNKNYDPVRRGPPRLHGMEEESRAKLVRDCPDYGEIVCQCRDVTLGEIRSAIRRGAVTLDGVKRRTGAGMGCCQGGRCMSRILEELSQAQSVPPGAITLDGAGSEILGMSDGTH